MGQVGVQYSSLNPESWIPTPEFQSRLRQHADLSKTNWFRVGGPADWLFKPNDSADLAAFFKALPMGVPVTVLGVGSNVIVRDGGIEGVVVKLGRGFTECTVLGAEHRVNESLGTEHSALSTILVGAACLDIHLAQFAHEQGIAGLEFMSGIPGTVGGAVKMNAGAYGSDVSKVLVSAEVVECDGTIRVLRASELGFAYRSSRLPEGAVVTKAVFRGQPGKREDIASRMAEIARSREETQPIRTRTGGSTFKNPDGHKAWELIDKAGCRGLKIGGAQVSELHCNFLINTGEATAADLEALGEEVIRRVKNKTGVVLEWEIKRVGRT